MLQTIAELQADWHEACPVASSHLMEEYFGEVAQNKKGRTTLVVSSLTATGELELVATFQVGLNDPCYHRRYPKAEEVRDFLASL